VENHWTGKLTVNEPNYVSDLHLPGLQQSFGQGAMFLSQMSSLGA